MTKYGLKKQLKDIIGVIPGTRPGYRYLRRTIYTLPLYFVVREKIRKFRAASSPRIIYALPPPPWFANLGDHAQTVAIQQWFKDHFPDFDVFEFDKDEGEIALDKLVKFASEDDIIFLSSGGNMGDRGRWSESLRRNIVSSFSGNRIISLPQTLYFSDSEQGHHELALSQQVYSEHPDLTIIARDEKSLELGRTYFSGVKTELCPDFVLYYDNAKKEDGHREGGLLCLREDKSSILTSDDYRVLEKMVIAKDFSAMYMNTMLEKKIKKKLRNRYLNEYLSQFLKKELVITDRFHGMIFSAITQTPCVALPTEDHKIIAGIRWFEDLPYIKLARTIEAVPEAIESVLNSPRDVTVDWKRKYFTPLAKRIRNDLKLRS